MHTSSRAFSCHNVSPLLQVLCGRWPNPQRIQCACAPQAAARLVNVRHRCKRSEFASSAATSHFVRIYASNSSIWVSTLIKILLLHICTANVLRQNGENNSRTDAKFLPYRWLACRNPQRCQLGPSEIVGSFALDLIEQDGVEEANTVPC